MFSWNIPQKKHFSKFLSFLSLLVNSSVEIEDDELYEMLLSRGKAVESDEDLTEKLSNCTVLAENLNNRLPFCREEVEKPQF